MEQVRLPLFFVFMAVILRVMPHIPNIAPVIGIGLFCGATLPKRWAPLAAVSAMAAGDLLLGWIPEHLFGWAAVALSAGIGFLLRKRRTVAGVVGCSALASTLFFLLSNFGVWLFGCGKGYYPADAGGLAACYAAGIPFYRNGLIGDVLYTAILFGGYELLNRWITHRSAAAVAASK
ncbi:MAG: hypothetical protein NC910_02385 [Candidatus Omnitrophica bacterium]|nr:hypothetical protein [Candidatus Omnitrophota bacterium]